MAGCRALTKHEVLKILNHLKNPRDRALFTLGIKSGFRISELLSLKIQDVMQFNEIVDRVRVRAMYMKGKDATRDVPLSLDARNAVRALIDSMPDKTGYLFKSRQGDAITRGQAHNVLKDAFNALKLNGKLATHSMRKTFAENVHKALGADIYKTAKAMGHKSIDSTAKYIAVDQTEIDKAILSI